MDGTTIFVSGLAALSFAGLYYNTSRYRKRTAEEEEYKQAKVHSPASLKKAMLQLEQLKKDKKIKDEEIVLRGFVEGKVECKEPLTSVLDKRTPLVYSVVFHDDIRSNDYLQIADRNSYEYLKYKTNEKNAALYFALRDPNPNSKDSFVLVHRNFEANTEYGLERIYQVRHNKDLNFLEKVLVFLGMIIEFFNMTKNENKNPFFRGMKIGWSETEFGIKINTPLTVFGDFVYNTSDKVLRIETPLYFLRDKSYLVNKVKNDAIANFFGSVLFLIPSIITGVYLSRKFYNYIKDYLRKRELRALDKARDIKALNLSDDYKCIICVTNPRNIILKPCLHFSICSACYANLHTECPVCRKHVDDTIEIFFT